MEKLNVSSNPTPMQLRTIKAHMKMGVAQDFIPLPSGNNPLEILLVRIDDKGNVTKVSTVQSVITPPSQHN